MVFDAKTLKYNDAGLIPAIAQDADTHEVLMMAWMNAEAVEKTLETGKVTYWSRSRQSFWIKGETSGHTQELVDFRYDCDQDCILVMVRHVFSLQLSLVQALSPDQRLAHSSPIAMRV